MRSEDSPGRIADGLTPRDPLVLKVRAVDDEAPQIVARRETLEQVVLDSEVVTFDAHRRDDFGVKRIGLEWIGSLDGRGWKDADQRREGRRGAASRRKRNWRCVRPSARRAKAWRRRRSRCARGRRIICRAGSTRARQLSCLHMLNKTDHALWLTEQFGKWLEVARESYEREQQLHQTNKELRALDAADLDRPENRRRVSQQAAAENANAARVDSLTQSGRSLVEQATKNDEFDARRLESWATMLKSLKDIAANRMPSVSDLLKQTANAREREARRAETGQRAATPQTPKAGETSKPRDAKSAPERGSRRHAATRCAGPRLRSIRMRRRSPLRRALRIARRVS